MKLNITNFACYLMGFFKSASDFEDREVQKTVTEHADKIFNDVARHTGTEVNPKV